MAWNSWGLTYGPMLGLSWLMCSLAPISQPQALTINPGWLLIGTEGDTGRPITGSLPEPPQLRWAYLQPCLCAVIGQLESIRMKGIGGLITDLSRSHTLKQEHERRCEELSARISELLHTQALTWNTHTESYRCVQQRHILENRRANWLACSRCNQRSSNRPAGTPFTPFIPWESWIYLCFGTSHYYVCLAVRRADFVFFNGIYLAWTVDMTKKAVQTVNIKLSKISKASWFGLENLLVKKEYLQSNYNPF